MTLDQREEMARLLWESSEHRPYSPAWEQLGEVTRDVWLAKVDAVHYDFLN